MKKANELTVTRSGAVYVGKLATRELGIYGYKWAAIQVSEAYIFIRIFKLNPPRDTKNDYIFPLHEKSGGKQAMTGNCIRFAEKLDFGDAESLDLHFSFVSRNEDGVLLKIGRPRFVDEEAKPESEEVIDKNAQAKVARWIMANGCDDVSCNGTEGRGRFNGVACPLGGSSFSECGRYRLEERIYAERWLISNGYPLDQETSLGTVSKPITERQLDIFTLPDKVASAPRTRPLPDGLPEWLSWPLSKGEQVRIVAFKSEEKRMGWVFGAFTDAVFGKPVAVVEFDNRTEPSFIFVDVIAPCLLCLKSAAECLAVAKELKIGLSPMQIDAISSGGVPPEGHELPDEMFE